MLLDWWTRSLLFPQFSHNYPLAFFIAVCQYVDMVCPQCQQKLTVTNSRHQVRNNSTWRRRECSNCQQIFTTHEFFDLPTSVSVRHSATHVKPFSRDKLFISIHESCKHRKDATEAAAALTDTIINQILPTIHQGVITRGDIILIAKRVLARFDKAAATHYNAYHPLK